MKFGNLDELIRYIIGENINLKYTDVMFSTNLKEDVAVKVDVAKVDVINEARILNFSDNPVVHYTIGTENIIYVEDFNPTKNFCGTSSMKVMDRMIVANVCEIDGNAHLNLSLDINGKQVHNLDFLVKSLADKPDDISNIQITEAILNETTNS